MGEQLHEIIHLRYGMILTDRKTRYFIIARINTEDYPLVFLREWFDDPFFEGYYYNLSGNALSAEQADEILDMLKDGNSRKANTLLKRYFKDGKPYCDAVGEVVLDDMIPDEWYDAWKWRLLFDYTRSIIVFVHRRVVWLDKMAGNRSLSIFLR